MTANCHNATTASLKTTGTRVGQQDNSFDLLVFDVVTMVFPEDRVMAKMFNEEMATFYEKYYADKGVKFIKEDVATGFEGNGKVESKSITPQIHVTLITCMHFIGSRASLQACTHVTWELPFSV